MDRQPKKPTPKKRDETPATNAGQKNQDVPARKRRELQASDSEQESRRKKDEGAQRSPRRRAEEGAQQRSGNRAGQQSAVPSSSGQVPRRRGPDSEPQSRRKKDEGLQSTRRTGEGTQRPGNRSEQQRGIPLLRQVLGGQGADSEQQSRRKKADDGSLQSTRGRTDEGVQRTGNRPGQQNVVPPLGKVPPREPKLLQSRIQPLNQPEIQKQQDTKPKDESKPSSYPPATLTGLSELKTGSAFLILLLWLPRFFIPWITSWHKYNVYILSNPYHWKLRQGDMDKHESDAFTCSCCIALFLPIVSEFFQKKWDFKYFFYSLLLFLFALCPVFGGYTEVLLRSGFIESEEYTKWWFTAVVLVRWTLSCSFAMFPIQVACIYAQNDNMSRNAHYSWTSIFMFLEFLNAFIVSLVIPPKCPTKEWTQIVVWVGIAVLLATITMMSLIFFCAVRACKYVMSCCFRKKKITADDSREPDPFLSVPCGFNMKKLMWCSMVLLPIAVSNFSFAVFERSVPDEDWDEQHFWTATSMFFLGRVMVLPMSGVLSGLRRLKVLQRRRAEILYMGVPHLFSILAFIILVGRLATLSRLDPGGIIHGPIPDDKKAVLLMFNVMFRNRTICITSEYFSPVEIRPFHYATRELYDLGVNNFTANVTVDPCSDSRLLTQFVVDNFTKGDWVVFGMALPHTNLTNEYVWDYYSRVYAVRLLQAERLRPLGVPKLVLFSFDNYFPLSDWYHQLNHSGFRPIEVQAVNTYDPGASFGATIDEFLSPQKAVILDLPATGTWTATTLSLGHNSTPEEAAWYASGTFRRVVEGFEVENFSLYYLVEYNYREQAICCEPNFLGSSGRSVRQDVPDDGFNVNFDVYKHVGFPQGFKLFKVAEVAAPNGGRVPRIQELQHDGGIMVALALAGMASGGLFLGFIYLFWVEPPIPAYRSTTLAVCWVLMGGAAEISKTKLVDVFTVGTSSVLLAIHIVLTALHVTGAYFMYNPALNFRRRAD